MITIAAEHCLAAAEQLIRCFTGTLPWARVLLKEQRLSRSHLVAFMHLVIADCIDSKPPSCISELTF